MRCPVCGRGSVVVLGSLIFCSGCGRMDAGELLSAFDTATRVLLAWVDEVKLASVGGH